MKYLLLACTLLFSFNIQAQYLVRVKDSINNFSVGLPSDWTTNMENPQDEMKLSAWRPLQDTTSKKVPPNVIVFVQQFSEEDFTLNSVVEMLELGFSQNNSFNAVLDSGTIRTFNQEMQWLNKKYVVDNMPDTLFSSIFISYVNNRIYVLMASCYDAERKENSALFKQIGNSLFVGDAVKEEFLKVSLPATTKWSVVSDDHVAEGRSLQMMPAGENLETWTSVYSGVATRFIKLRTIDEVLKFYIDSWKQMLPNINIVSIKKGSKADEKWALVHAQATPSDTSLPKEHSLYYFLLTDHYLHLHSVTTRGSELTPELIRAWGDAFRNGKIVLE